VTDPVRWGVLGATSEVARQAVLPALAASPTSAVVATASRDHTGFGPYERLLAAPPVAGSGHAPSAGPSPPRQALVTALADGRHRDRRRWRAGVASMSACAAVTLVVLGIVTPHEPSTTPPLGRFIAAHETEVGAGDPVSELATAVVPAGFSR